MRVRRRVNNHNNLVPLSHEGERAHRLERRRVDFERLIPFVAWCVHLYTAMGLVVGAVIAVLLVRGDPDAFRGSFALMLLATLIDATDGTMARRIKVKKVLPDFDGRKLDDITDFLTYTFLPLLLVWRAHLLPTPLDCFLVLPLLASAYGFCQIKAKTEDGFFLGFPSLWNCVAFYLYILQPPVIVTLGTVILLSVLTFVPSRYLYPSQPGVLNVLSNVLGGVWAILIASILLLLPAGAVPPSHGPAWILALLSLYYPAFYMIVSWAITLRHHARRTT